MTSKWATWTVTEKCGASPKCSYCIQGQESHHSHPPSAVIVQIMDSLEKLQGCWQVSLLGGEIFDIDSFGEDLLPYFCSATSHTISFTSNFLASNTTLSKALRKKPSAIQEMRFSFHGELWSDPHIFLWKMDAFIALVSSQQSPVSIKVAIPLVPRYFNFIIDQLVPWLKRRQINYFFQLLKIRKKTGIVPFPYPPHQLITVHAMLRKLQHESQVVRINNHFNQYCWGGSRLIAIKPNGDVFACYNFIDADDKMGRLGNICAPGFALFNKPIRCTFTDCACGAAEYSKLIENKAA